LNQPEIDLKQILYTPLHFINGIQHHFPPCCILSFCIDHILPRQILTKNGTKHQYEQATCPFHNKNPSKLQIRNKAKYHISHDKRLPNYPVYIKETAIDTLMFNINKKQILKEEG
jgi:hypothetical protein